jgi:hypothetical protein
LRARGIDDPLRKAFSQEARLWLSGLAEPSSWLFIKVSFSLCRSAEGGEAVSGRRLYSMDPL